jgi:hypothetical protein
MGFRFSRRFSVSPNWRVNVSRSGPSMSVGARGMWFTAGAAGTRASIGVPGVPGAYFVAQSRRGSSAIGAVVVLILLALLLKFF